MSLVDKDSIVGGTSALSVNSVPATQTGITSTTVTVINPRNPVTSQPLIFDIPASSLFLKPDRTTISLKLRIVKENGTKLSATTDVVGPVNYIGGTYFETIRLFMNNKLIYDTGIPFSSEILTL